MFEYPDGSRLRESMSDAKDGVKAAVPPFTVGAGAETTRREIRVLRNNHIEHSRHLKMDFPNTKFKKIPDNSGF